MPQNALPIPGGLAVAFQTRRKEFLHLELARLRGLAQVGKLTGEALDHVLNALEMLSSEMWDLQDCLGAVGQMERDLYHQVNGLQRHLEVLHDITQAGLSSSTELPPGGPAAVREHFNLLSKNEYAARKAGRDPDDLRGE